MQLSHSKPIFSLCVDASGEMASAAIFKHTELLATAAHQARHGHAETLIGLCEDVLSEASVKASSLDRIVGGCGPGSFTGLRVCLAAAQGYVLATGAQAIGVSGLAALAFHQAQALPEFHNENQAKQVIISCVDSRCNSLFLQAFDTGLTPLTDILDVASDQVEKTIDKILDSHQASRYLMSGTLCPEVQLSDEMRTEFIPLMVDAVLLGRLATYPEHKHGNLPLEPLYVLPPRLGKKTAQPSSV